MQVQRRLFLALFFIVAVGTTGQAADHLPLKVLFIGNSYTFVNDLPSLIVGLAEAAGGRKIEADQHLVGGCTLERHVKEKKAVEKIREKKWDVVVLQEHSLQPIIDRDSMYRNARILDEEIKKRGAKTVFYLTWARQRRHDPKRDANGSATIRADVPGPSPVGHRTAAACNHQVGRDGADPWPRFGFGVRHRRERPLPCSQRA